MFLYKVGQWLLINCTGMNNKLPASKYLFQSINIILLQTGIDGHQVYAAFNSVVPFISKIRHQLFHHSASMATKVSQEGKN